jgi:sortase A
MRFMRVVENSLWLCGSLLIGLYFFSQVRGESARQHGIAEFDEHKQHSAQISRLEPEPSTAIAALPTAVATLPPVVASTPVVEAITSVIAPLPLGATIAVLRIPRIKLEVPVADGTTERVLLGGAGLVEGTATPGTQGNVAIAAHRDTFFRGLKDVVVGDLIELETLQGTDIYRISTLSIVEPRDVHVLADTGEAVLTLVTCYPFYFVGNAPQRFIVRAVAAELHSQPPRRKT